MDDEAKGKAKEAFGGALMLRRKRRPKMKQKIKSTS
jgi:hypothetical protein